MTITWTNFGIYILESSRPLTRQFGITHQLILFNRVIGIFSFFNSLERTFHFLQRRIKYTLIQWMLFSSKIYICSVYFHPIYMFFHSIPLYTFYLIFDMLQHFVPALIFSSVKLFLSKCLSNVFESRFTVYKLR